MCILWCMLFQQAVHEVYVLKDCKIHIKTSEPESPFHKVAGLQPEVSFKKILRLRCFPVNFHKFLKNVFHRTPPGDCLLKFYFRFIMACK